MSLRVSKLFLGLTAIFGLTTLLSTSCIEVDYPDISFRCNPVKDGGDACPEGFQCCSDDPTAYDGTAGAAVGVLPDYSMNFPSGRQPIFSAANNALSSTGMCISDGVREDLLDAAGGLTQPAALGCPIPCNPGWDATEVGQVCGANSLCCQTVEMDATDCVFDSNAQCFRPASGAEIQADGVQKVDSDGTPVGAVNWAPGDHDTMQDPGGTNCTSFAAGDTAKRNACFRALNVANARGFCLQRSATVTACPLASAAYIDPCEELNTANGFSGC